MTDSYDSIAGIVTMLRRRKRSILVTGAVVGVLAFATARVWPSYYTSEGTLIIETRANSDATVDPNLSNGVLTQMDVIQSRGLIKHVVDRLHLTTATLAPNFRLPLPIIHALTATHAYVSNLWRFVGDSHRDETDDKVILYVQDHLNVIAKSNSSAITIRFAAATPYTAVTVLSAIMNTYLATMEETRDAKLETIDRWVAEQMAAYQRAISDAQQRVTQYGRDHNLAEVQGSLTQAVQYSKDQQQLALAREELARQEAALNEARNGEFGAEETLNSKTIQSLKAEEARLNAQIGAAAAPRTTLQAGAGASGARLALASVRAQIDNETKLILDSIAQNVRIAAARVKALESLVNEQSNLAQNTSVFGVISQQLTDDLDAKRRLYVDFVSHAEQERLAAEQAPMTHILFPATPIFLVHSYEAIALLGGFVVGLVGASVIVVLRSILVPPRLIQLYPNAADTYGTVIYDLMQHVARTFDVNEHEVWSWIEHAENRGTRVADVIRVVDQVEPPSNNG